MLGGQPGRIPASCAGPDERAVSPSETARVLRLTAQPVEAQTLALVE